MSKVLVVEDDRISREALSRILKMAGYETVCVDDGAAALKTVASAPPDAVLLDLNLPRTSGWDVLKYLRGNATTRAVPVIILSGERSQRQRKRALELGANGYLVKAEHPLSEMFEQIETHILDANARAT
jgi:DNA-binding response OmpR family regulator